MIFRAPFFQVLTDQSLFEQLVGSLSNKFGNLSSASLGNPLFDENFYLVIPLGLCPLNGFYFKRTDILEKIDLSSRNYTPPNPFGPFYFSAGHYDFEGSF